MSVSPQILLAATVPDHFRAFHLPWIKRLHEFGCTVHGAADQISQMPECVAAFDAVHDVPFSRNPLKLKAAATAGREMSRIIERQKIDLVHVHTPVAAFVTRRYAHPFRAARGLKIIYTAHGFHFHDRGKPYTNFLFEMLEKKAGKWTDFLVVVNRADEKAARRLQIVPDDRIVYMPGVGIDLDDFSPARVTSAESQKIRGELKLSPADKLVTMVAELSPVKRHADALQALARLNRPDVHLAIVGDGKTRPKIEAQIAQLGLSKTVHLLGHRRDIPALFRAADLALLTSGREGLPRSVMEALCLEIPVVGTDVRGIRDLLAGGGGIIVPVGDVARLAEAIRELVDHPEKARQMGEQGRCSMRSYSLPDLLKLHEQLYARALGSLAR
jgi:glycosyltransferase involved in cell wall biosynthesis